ncbi:zinc finger protein ubi-d4-like isoform X2 [Ceratina calcarata]|uniref:Zinc finger protein ubi-d4-like isoform X2 n=1 Tax=Ceratina calcarata TaxID=156304 RepID=A0AAJ7S3C0_9HYME|nr:zinc finger protein ubi-d4-like isoform X2 [Ceratina calcarata]
MQQHRVETQIVHEEQILEAIDQLRRRKARPDADRICNYLLRKFSVDARDTIADLHRLIEAEKVIQVDYKGNTSYRNASKWSRLQLYKNRPEGFVKEKLNSGMVAGAVAELVVEEPDYLDQGVPAYRLIEQLLDGVSNPTSRRMVEDFLGKEVASGGLYDFDESENLTITDSRSNTPRSSRQASPKSDPQIRKEECYEIIVGRDKNVKSPIESDPVKDQEPQDEPLETSAKDVKEESKNVDGQAHNLKRSSKAERKQRLLVRTDDPMDIEIKFEDYRKDNKEETNSQKEKREETGHLSEEREDEDAGRSSTNPSPTPSNTNFGGFRSARRKRAKKVFDPSDNNLVKRKRGRQPGSQNKPSAPQEPQDTLKTVIKDGPCRQCSLCAKEKQETLVACRDCTVRAHPSCIYSPEEMIQKVGSSWQCERCKSCTVCCETSDAGPLATCSSCDEAYHYYCHTPRIIIPKSNSKWQCNDCVQKQYKTNISQNISLVTSRPDTPSNPPALPPVLSPQVSPARATSDTMEDDVPRDGIDPNIPDASDWTSDQVYQYFARLFPKEAEVFRQQDIDGHSLLLMKRSDVLSGLDLLLGPALKIYRHVLKLQVRRDDPKLYWL